MQAGVGVLEDAGGEMVTHVRARVATRLRARQRELVKVIFARVRGGAFARQGDQDAEYLAGLHATVAAAVEYGLEGIERGEQWAGPIPLVAVAQARRAARIGVSLDTVLRRYVLGHTLLGEYVMETASPTELPGERGALREALRAQASVLDRLLEAITREYQDEVARTEGVRAGRSPEQRRSEHVCKLLDGGTLEQPGLDYELAGWHLGMIAIGTNAAQAAEALLALAARLDRRLLSVGHDQHTVWAWLGGKTRLTAGALERAIPTTVAEGMLFAVGEPAKGLEGWRLTHQQAQHALLVAQRRPQTLTRYADVVLLAATLKDPALAKALVEIYLSPLDDSRNRGPLLRQTLHAYLAAERNASSTASALRIARSTLASRLRMIEERIERTLSSCPAELEIALQLDKLDMSTRSNSTTGGENIT